MPEHSEGPHNDSGWLYEQLWGSKRTMGAKRTRADIAEECGVSAATISRRVKLYQRRGEFPPEDRSDSVWCRYCGAEFDEPHHRGKHEIHCEEARDDE